MIDYTEIERDESGLVGTEAAAKAFHLYTEKREDRPSKMCEELYFDESVDYRVSGDYVAIV